MARSHSSAVAKALASRRERRAASEGAAEYKRLARGGRASALWKRVTPGAGRISRSGSELRAATFSVQGDRISATCALEVYCALLQGVRALASLFEGA